MASTELVDACRRRVLAFFNASPDVYTVVFTANASHALKLVGEAYPFEAGDRLLLTFDNHNSVNGIREFDRARGAETSYVPVVPQTSWRIRPFLTETSTLAETGATLCSHSPRNPTSRGYTTHSNGSVARELWDGTCCSTPQHSFRRIRSTSVDTNRTSSLSRSTKCSGTRQVSVR